MLLDIIENYKLKREIKLAEWEKKRIQTFCPHNIISLEQYEQGYSNGYGTRCRTIYPAYCSVCEKTFEFRNRVELKHILAKQKARS